MPRLECMGSRSTRPQGLTQLSVDRDGLVHIVTGPNFSGKSVFLKQVMAEQNISKQACRPLLSRLVLSLCWHILVRSSLLKLQRLASSTKFSLGYVPRRLYLSPKASVTCEAVLPQRWEFNNLLSPQVPSSLT